MLESSGVPSTEQVKSKFPISERIDKRAFALIECYQNIPCNPCSTSCPFGAISMNGDINNIPTIDFEVCTGCGVCVYNCPGLAISVVDSTVSEKDVLFKIPYELLPVPNKGDVVKGMNRDGENICDAVVKRVINSKVQDKTSLVFLEVSKEFMYDFITIKVGE